MIRFNRIYRSGEHEQELIVEVDDMGVLTSEERAQLLNYFMPVNNERTTKEDEESEWHTSTVNTFHSSNSNPLDTRR